MFNRIRWLLTADRLGPDLPLTHLFLHVRMLGSWICRRKFAHFGDGAWIRPHTYCYFTDRIHVGNNVVVRPGSKLIASHLDGGEIILEDDVLLAPDITIVTNTHAFDDPMRPISMQGHYEPKRVVVKSGAWVGTRVVILPGVTIGKNAVVGAGSVVTRSVPDFCVAVGSPARVVKKIEENGGRDRT